MAELQIGTKSRHLRRQVTGCAVFGLLLGVGEQRVVVGSSARTFILVVIEIVDAPEKIEAFLPELYGMVQEGLVTVERAQVILYRGPDKPRG